MSADLVHRNRLNPAGEGAFGEAPTLPAQTFTPVEATLIPAGEFPAADRMTSRRP